MFGSLPSIFATSVLLQRMDKAWALEGLLSKSTLLEL
jgi:hypothetical protein